jgi:alkylhydroperoxidase family enzyme
VPSADDLSPNEPRVKPLPAEVWSDDVRELLSGSIPGVKPLSESAWLTTLAHNPRLMRRFGPLANHLLLKGRLSPRQRELLILRTGWLCQAPYEWSEHVHIARQSGVTADDVERIIVGPQADGWTPLEAALVRAVDDIHVESVISDATWATLAASYDEAELIELLMVVGMYHLIAWTQNSLRVQLDADRRGLAER